LSVDAYGCWATTFCHRADDEVSTWQDRQDSRLQYGKAEQWGKDLSP